LAGIYIHIPFCRKACYYCNFHFSTSLLLKDKMIHAILKEISMHASGNNEAMASMILEKSESITSVYFGGGTPSILNQSELQSIFFQLHKFYNIHPDAEVTLEANPDDINQENLAQWRVAGINRLSIGIQSFFDRDLKWMNRSHSAAQAKEAITLARKAGFTNFSADLIFGIPGLTDSEFMYNIRCLIELQTPHIAAYALTVEPATALHKMIALNKKEEPEANAQAAQFELLMQEMKRAGYEHYEISNFALPGMRSRHNSSYWQQKKYLGIGPSAHSYDGRSRYWNIAHNPKYIDLINQGKSAFEKEDLTKNQMYNEYIMTSLRTIEGIDLQFLQNQFSKEIKERTVCMLQKMNSDWFYTSANSISLTNQGKLFADKIASDLFVL